MEEVLYALSDISQSLSFLRQSQTNWQSLTDLPSWRTRWDSETRLLVEEEDNSKTQWGDWKVKKVHPGIESQTEAILLAAKLTLARQEVGDLYLNDTGDEPDTHDRRLGVEDIAF